MLSNAASPVFARVFKTKKESVGTYLGRWFEFVSSLDAAQLAVKDLQNASKVYIT